MADPNPNDLPITGGNGQSVNQVQNNPSGTTGTNFVAPASATSAIPVDQTGNQTPLNLGSTINTANGGIADATAAASETTIKGLPDYINSLTPPKTATDTKQQAILDEIASLTDKEGQKGQDTLDLRKQYGIEDKQTTLQNLNNELTGKVASYNKQFSTLGGNGTVETSAVYNAQTAGLKVAQAADIGLITARISAAQGNLSLAQQQVTDAINLKYSTIEAELNTKKAQLDALIPTLNKEEKVAAEAQKQMLADRATAIADEKAKVKTNLDIVVQGGIKTPFVNNNGKFFDARTGLTFKDEASFYKAAGVTSFAEAYQKGLVSDVNPATLADKNLIAQAAAKYPDAGIKLTDTPEEMQAKLQNSRIYKKDTYIAPNAYTNPFGPNSSGSTIDLSKYTDKNAPQGDLGGLSVNGLTQAAKLYLADSGKMPSLGLGSAKATQMKRDAIINYAGQLADSMGMDINQISALYKANSKAAGTIIDRIAKIDTTSATLVSQFPRLAQLAASVGNLGITEQDLSAGKAAAMRKFGSVDAANYIELVQTIRGDYSALQASLSGGRGGQYFVANAKDAIPLGLTPDQYNGIANTIQTSAENARNATSQEASNIIGNYTAPAGTPTGTAPANTTKMQGPDGNLYYVPNDQVEHFKENGGKPVSFNPAGNASASKIADAIKSVESNGNYNAKGGSGENGAYQFMPASWNQWSKQYLGKVVAMTPENQDKVAQARIQDLLDKGYNAKQIALIWNGGTPKAKAGVNKFGVKYDSGAYANKVLKALG